MKSSLERGKGYKGIKAGICMERREFAKLFGLGVLGSCFNLNAGDEQGSVKVSDGEMADHPWDDGLYSTITAPFVKYDTPSGIRKTVVKVKGMKEGMDGVSVVGDKGKDLIVVINGT